MRELMFFLFTMISPLSFGQTNIITGKVIDADLESLPEVKFFDHDTILLGITDLSGNFKVELPATSSTLLISALGMEPTQVKLNPNCNIVNVVMLNDGTYDYMSGSKIDRVRKKEFDKLPQLYSQAFSRGLFTENAPCYSRDFVPIKPRLDKIRERLKVKQTQIKRYFKKLQIGDTISIPFSTSHRADGTDRTELIYYSYVMDGEDFDCVIKGILVDKDKSNGGYNITYKVTNCDLCNHGSLIYGNNEVSIGRVFRYNMKYFKIIDNVPIGPSS